METDAARGMGRAFSELRDEYPDFAWGAVDFSIAWIVGYGLSQAIGQVWLERGRPIGRVSNALFLAASGLALAVFAYVLAFRPTLPYLVYHTVALTIGGWTGAPVGTARTLALASRGRHGPVASALSRKSVQPFPLPAYLVASIASGLLIWRLYYYYRRA